jgi:hypothetical protein
MTINSGEKVRFLLIAQNPFSYEEASGHPDIPRWVKGGTGCHLTDFWQPVSLPILAEYNDYGTIEKWDESETPYITMLMRIVNETSVKLKVGENEYHDLAVKDGLNFEEFLDVVREGRLYLNGFGHPVATAGVFIKESVWQSLINDTNFTAEDTEDMWKAEESTMVSIKQRLDKQLKLAEQKLRKMSTRSPAETIADLRELLELGMECSDNRSYAWNINSYRHLMVGIPINDQRFVEIERLFSILSILRIDLSPTIGSGSQTPNEKLFRKVYKLWTNIADKQTHYLDEDMET